MKTLPAMTTSQHIIPNFIEVIEILPQNRPYAQQADLPETPT
jgi:hypothetical protein